MKSPIAIWRRKRKDYQFLGKTGKIVSFSKVFNPPEGFGKLPYYVAVVEFKAGKRKIGQLVLEGKEPKIGAKVGVVIRRIGQPGLEEVINYGIKFKLIKS